MTLYRVIVFLGRFDSVVFFVGGFSVGFLYSFWEFRCICSFSIEGRGLAVGCLGCFFGKEGVNITLLFKFRGYCCWELIWEGRWLESGFYFLF